MKDTISSGAMVKSMVYDHVATGAKARDLRVRRGVSMRQVARGMGLAVSYVSDLERGRRPWRAELVQRFLEALGA